MATDEIKMDIIFRLIVPQSQLRDVVMYLLPFMDDDAYAEMRIHAEDDAPINETCDECGGQGEPVCPLCDQTMYRCGDMWGCDRCNLCINTHADCMAPLKKPDGSDDHATPWTPMNPDKQGTPDMDPATDWIPGVKFDKDGDQWMCAGVDFKVLTEDPAGFGDTKVEAYKAYLLEPDIEKPAGTCRVCGCTESTACQDFDDDGKPQPCHWVDDDLCSACAREGKNNAGLDNQ